MRRAWVLAMAMGCGGGSSEDVSEQRDGGTDAAASTGTDAAIDAAQDAGGDAAADAAVPLTQFSFKPSNITLAQLPELPAQDLRISTQCDFNSETGSLSCSGHTSEYNFATVDAEGGVRIGILRARSVTVDMSGELRVRGPLPLIIAANEAINVLGRITAAADMRSAYAGGFPSPSTTGDGMGPGGGKIGTVGQFRPSGGGSYCGTGGHGALTMGQTGAVANGGTPYGTPNLIPLLGGSSGGGGSAETGAGGGAVQLVSAKQITIGATGRIDAGGGGARNSASGGGSGGGVLLEAPTVTISGVVATNGGGGSAARGGAGGQNGQASAQPAAGETASSGANLGGAGSAGANANGEDGQSIGTNDSVGGGGGAGRIRVNTQSGSGALTGTLSPPPSTTCATEGTLLPL